MGTHYSTVKIFISTSHREPDISLAKEFAQNLEDLGYIVFLAKNSIFVGEDWQHRLNIELDSCDYMLLLLSENSVTSEMVYYEVKRIQERQNSLNRPLILPVRINLPYDVNYDLAKQLEKIHQLDWEREEDTPLITEKISNSISQNSSFGVSKKKIPLSYTNMPVPNAPLILEQPSGTVALDSHYYIERDSDKECYQNLHSRHTLIRIKAPRQYGKTSLLARLILDAKESEYYVVSFNFQEFDKSLLTNLEKLLNSICKIVAYKLNIQVSLNEMILQMFTPKMRAGMYMEEILSKINQPLVFVIDEADRLFEYQDVSNEFFGLIRAWSEKAKSNLLWERLKIVLSHSTEPLLGVTDLNQSPFHNVGLEVKLKPFNKDEIKELSIRHGIELAEDELLKLIGGHPYLSRLIMFTMVNEQQSFDSILKNAYSQESIFLDHIKRYIWIINGNQRLKNAIKELLKNNNCTDDYSCYTLEATGLIRNQLNKPKFSCELYRNFFSRLIL